MKQTKQYHFIDKISLIILGESVQIYLMDIKETSTYLLESSFKNFKKLQ